MIQRSKETVCTAKAAILLIFIQRRGNSWWGEWNSCPPYLDWATHKTPSDINCPKTGQHSYKHRWNVWYTKLCNMRAEHTLNPFSRFAAWFRASAYSNLYCCGNIQHICIAQFLKYNTCIHVNLSCKEKSFNYEHLEYSGVAWEKTTLNWALAMLALQEIGNTNPHSPD